MHLECGVVSVDFVQEHFRVVVLWQQDFELQGARFIFQATCSVRLQQRQELIPLSWGDFNRGDDRKFCHVTYLERQEEVRFNTSPIRRIEPLHRADLQKIAATDAFFARLLQTTP